MQMAEASKDSLIAIVTVLVFLLWKPVLTRRLNQGSVASGYIHRKKSQKCTRAFASNMVAKDNSMALRWLDLL